MYVLDWPVCLLEFADYGLDHISMSANIKRLLEIDTAGSEGHLKKMWLSE